MEPLQGCKTVVRVLIKYLKKRMIRESKRSKTLLKIISKGYTIDRDGKVYNSKGKFIKGYINQKNGYRWYGTRLNGIANIYVGHQFQAYMKFGDEIFNTACVRHLNGIPSDNSWDNITIGSHRDNIMDRSVECRKISAGSPKHDHKAILADRALGMNYRQIMEKYKISSKGTLSFIVNSSIAQEI